MYLRFDFRVLNVKYASRFPLKLRVLSVCAVTIHANSERRARSRNRPAFGTLHSAKRLSFSLRHRLPVGTTLSQLAPHLHTVGNLLV